MPKFKWEGGPRATVMTTELDNLADDANAISVEIDNSNSLYLNLFDDVEWHHPAMTYATGTEPAVELYLVRTELDGTGYEDGNASIDPPAANLVGVFHLRPSTTEAQRHILRQIPIPASKFKYVVINKSGQPIPTGAPLRRRGYRYRNVTGGDAMFYLATTDNGVEQSAKIQKLAGNGGLTDVFTGYQHFYGMDVDYANGKIYWVALEQNLQVAKLERINIDGSGKEFLRNWSNTTTSLRWEPFTSAIYLNEPLARIIYAYYPATNTDNEFYALAGGPSGEVGSIENLSTAKDESWTMPKVFWVEVTWDDIQRTRSQNTDETGLITLRSSSVDEYGPLAVNTKLNKVYQVIDISGIGPSLIRMNYDGSSSETLRTDSVLTWPRDMHIDVQTGDVWILTDALGTSSRKVYRFDSEGSTRTEFFSGPVERDTLLISGFRY